MFGGVGPLGPYRGGIPASTLTLALRRWPPVLPTFRPRVRVSESLWEPPRRLPDWLRWYLFVEVPLPFSAVPLTPSPFRQGIASIPSCLAVQGVLAALHHAQSPGAGWFLAETRRPSFRYRKHGGTITTSIRLSKSDATPGEPIPAPWSVVTSLGDLDGDVLLIVLAHALNAPDAERATWITADAILDARGLRRKTAWGDAPHYGGGHRREDRLRVGASMAHLDHLWLHLQDVEMVTLRPGARPRRTRHTHDGKLLHISEHLVQDGVAVAWRYRPGSWLAPFLKRPNRQTALLQQQALRYDPYRRRWEKRLARYVTFHFRMDARRRAPLVRRIGPLLDELGLTVDHRHPERTRARFEAALGRLAQDGVIGSYRYPDEAQDRLAALPARQWVDRWRAMTVVVTAPPAIAAHYAAMGSSSRTPYV